jgi:hypothetical protein
MRIMGGTATYAYKVEKCDEYYKIVSRRSGRSATHFGREGAWARPGAHDGLAEDRTCVVWL